VKGSSNAPPAPAAGARGSGSHAHDTERNATAIAWSALCCATISCKEYGVRKPDCRASKPDAT
jgi:hypothetical protein